MDIFFSFSLNNYFTDRYQIWYTYVVPTGDERIIIPENRFVRICMFGRLFVCNHLISKITTQISSKFGTHIWHKLRCKVNIFQKKIMNIDALCLISYRVYLLS